MSRPPVSGLRGSVEGVALSPRQKDALCAVVKYGGLRGAARAGWSKSSIDHNIRMAREKLGAQTTTHAVVLAFPVLGARYELPGDRA